MSETVGQLRRCTVKRPFVSGAWPWMMPVVITVGIFYLYPLLDVFRLSWTNATLIGENYDYTGASVANTLTTPYLGGILWVTFLFTLGSVIGQQLFGLAIALVVIRGERRRLMGMTVLRTTVLVAWVVPGIAGGIIWQMLFSEAPYGALNNLLRMVHIAPVPWLSDPTVALWSAIVSNVWRGTAFSMVVMYAALKSIDPVLYEAADVDGASAPQKLVLITLPQLRSAILVNMILITIMTLNTFDAIIALTGGGPGRATEVISLYVFNIVFRNYDLAGGSVLSVVMLVISMSLAIIYAWFLPREEPA